MSNLNLDDLKIAAPCHEDWNEMSGDERVRRCAACKLDVFNISEMTEEDAVDLIESRAGQRTCVKLFRRADGTVITKNCPVGLRALRKRVRRLVAVGVAGVATLLTSLVFAKWAIDRAAAKNEPVVVDMGFIQ